MCREKDREVAQRQSLVAAKARQNLLKSPRFPAPQAVGYSEMFGHSVLEPFCFRHVYLIEWTAISAMSRVAS